jgi:hypothetical protein
MLLVVAAVISVSAVVGVGPAVAKTKPNISCTLTGTATVSPGLSPISAIQTITVTTSLSGCTGSTVAGITGTSSSTTTSGAGKKASNCSSLGKKSVTKTPSSVIHWNNGQTSTDTYKTSLLAITATVKGKISGGDFLHGKVKAMLTYIPNGDCTHVPITSATLSGTFNIT